MKDLALYFLVFAACVGFVAEIPALNLNKEQEISRVAQVKVKWTETAVSKFTMTYTPTPNTKMTPTASPTVTPDPKSSPSSTPGK